MEQQGNPDMLHEFEQVVILDPAERILRFVNWIVDRIVFIGLFYFMVFLSALIWSSMVLAQGGDPRESVLAQSIDSDGFGFVILLLYLALYVLYFTIIEGSSKGRSLGKLITGTTAIRQDGNPITWKDALMRSLCRLIPFEPFSAFSYYPWHDSITKTMVIKKTR